MSKYGWRNNDLTAKDITIESDLSIEGDLSFGDASTDTITVNGSATFKADVQIDDNKTLQFEGIAADLDGMTIAVDNAGDADISVTAGTLVINTSDNAISMTGETLTVGTLTDGTCSITGGDISSVGTITATTVSDGTASLSAGTITDGTLSITTGNLTAVNTMNFTPTVVADTSMYPIRIAYNYAGATINTGVDMDLYSIRSSITQTSSNDKATLGQRGYMQGIRSDIVLNGFADTAYAFYANVSAAGASTVNGMYGVTSVMNTGSDTISLDESGFIAGVRTNVSGTGDVTCAGTGYGKLVGFYVSWLHTNALTVDSAGYHIGIKAGATLDSGYRVNASGTLINSFHSYNSSGTMTNVIKVDGAHSFFVDFDDATTCAAAITAAATTAKNQILVKCLDGSTGYINVYSSTGT